MLKINHLFCLLISLILIVFSNLYASPLPANIAYQPSIKIADPNTLHLTFVIQPNYYLYQNKFSVENLGEKSIDISPLRLPPAIDWKDHNGTTHAVYANSVTIPLFILGDKTYEGMIRVLYQGCSKQGFCYPPMDVGINLVYNTDKGLKSATIAPTVETKQNQNTNEKLLSQQSLFWAVISFFSLGLLLAFTPCVLPMLPVLSSMLLGKGQQHIQKFLIASTYVFSMALTYAGIGASVAYLGKNFALTLQTPLITSIFAGLIFIMGLSMFDLISLHLPNLFDNPTRKTQINPYIKALTMGMLATLILSPCVTAPLVGALTYIANTGDITLGLIALFSLGLGMGVPLLLISLSAERFIPKTGAWLLATKSLLGFVLFGMCLYLLARFVPLNWIYLGSFALGIMMVIYFMRAQKHLSLASIGLIVTLLSAYQWINFKPSISKFPIVTNLMSLETEIAKNIGKPIILDFYADWCISCHELDKKLNTTEGLKLLQKIQLIKVDITNNTDEQQQLLQTYHVIAPPTLIFLNAKGQELVNKRLVGEMSLEQIAANF